MNENLVPERHDEPHSIVRNTEYFTLRQKQTALAVGTLAMFVLVALYARSNRQIAPVQTPPQSPPVTGPSPDRIADRDLFYDAHRDPPYLANEVSGHQTRSAAIAALAAQFHESTTWIEANMGESNSLAQIHSNLVRARFASEAITSPRVGHVNYSLIQTFKDAWRKEGLRNKSKTEKAEALALIILVVRTDIEDQDDEEATLDHIQQTIDSW